MNTELWRRSSQPVALRRMSPIAFQGERGAFSEEAARKLLGDTIEVLPCRTFDDVFAAVADGRAEAAVVPIENTLAGSVLRNFELLASAHLSIRGEVLLRIAHALIAPRGTNVVDIRRVYSHPVALAQCQRFFAAHRGTIEAIAADDTAGSVRMVVERAAAGEAAIAAAGAATIYGADVLINGIEDHRENYTRFLLLAREGSSMRADGGGARKTSLMFVAPNKPGSLFRALAAFALREIDLMKIESRPIEGRPWEYAFYVDLAGDADEPNVARAIDHLREMCEVVRLFGSYAAAFSESGMKDV
jgi:prephenate dehydratase